MSDRITRQNIEDRVANLNSRMESRQSIYRYQVEARNGHIALDRFTRSEDFPCPDSVPGRGIGWICQATVTVGTKREVAEFLHAMMVGIDDLPRV